MSRSFYLEGTTSRGLQLLHHVLSNHTHFVSTMQEQLSLTRGNNIESTLEEAPPLRPGLEATKTWPIAISGWSWRLSTAGLDINMAGKLQQYLWMVYRWCHPLLGICYVGCRATRAHRCKGGIGSAVGDVLGRFWSTRWSVVVLVFSWFLAYGSPNPINHMYHAQWLNDQNWLNLDQPSAELSRRQAPFSCM